MTAMTPIGQVPEEENLAPAGHGDEAEGIGSLAGWYLIIVLTLAYTVSFVDRQVLNLLVGPIKAEFGLSDTQLSLLQGLAFTSAYVLMSPLFGRVADTGSRKGVLVFGIALWSIATSCCGLARTYWQLFLARCGVGGAEACLTPAAWSIIADAFPPRMIPRAFSVYMMGPYLGGGLALIFGGLLLQGTQSWDLSAIPLLGAMKPWQLVFFLAGVPGLAVGIMMMFVKEPPRRSAIGETPGEARKMTGEEIRATFRRWRGFYGNFYVGMPFFIVTLYAFPAWMPTVMIRKFGVPAAQVGIEYGTAVLITGSLGVLVSPWVARLAERFGRRDSLMLVPVIACAIMVPLSLALMAASTYRGAFAIATLASLVYSLPQALSSSALQLVTPNRMRGIASSIYVFVISVAGLALAPTAVAVITNTVFRDENRVGDALAITCSVAAAAGAVFLFHALPAYRRMLDEPA